MAYSWAIMPPIDMPIRWKPLMPRSSTSAFASSASMRLVYGPGGGARLADAAVVEPQHPVAGTQQVGHLEVPGLEVVGEAVDEHDRLVAVALDAVVDLDVVDLCGRHVPSFLLDAGSWSRAASDVAGGQVAGAEVRHLRVVVGARGRWRRGQRGWKRQPDGGEIGLGISPASAGGRSRRDGSGSGIAASSACV